MFGRLFGNREGLGSIYADFARQDKEQKKKAYKENQEREKQIKKENKEREKQMKHADQVIRVIEKHQDGTVVEKTTYVYNKR